MEIIVQKTSAGYLIPVDDEGIDFLRTIGAGKDVKVKIIKARNLGFHRKFFAMLTIGFEAWEPEEEYKGVTVQKEKEVFREDCIIQAGFRYPVARIDGSFRWKAESISFASMSQERFEEVYSAVANVLLQKILANYTRDDLDQHVERILGFV